MDYPVSLGLSGLRAGRLLMDIQCIRAVRSINFDCIASSGVACEESARSVPFGKYCLINPLVFSCDPVATDVSIFGCRPGQPRQNRKFHLTHGRLRSASEGILVPTMIREAQGRSSIAMRDGKHQNLIAECKKFAAYRQEIEELRAKVANLAYINEVLFNENRVLKA